MLLTSMIFFMSSVYSYMMSFFSCGNVNFAFRGVCNRCGASRPSGVSGSGGGGGRGRGRGSDDARGNSRAPAVGGPPGLFGPNDWPCTM